MVQVRIGDDTVELSYEEWEERVRRGRIPGDALVRIEGVTGGAFVRADGLEVWRSLAHDAAATFERRWVAGAPPILTALLVGVQIRLYWWAWIPPVQAVLESRFTSFTPAVLEEREVWRLLTMGVLQTANLHLALNMLWLAFTGWNLERALGRANVGVIFVASVLVGSSFSIFGSPWTPSLGSSGGVFGLIGASVLFGFLRPDLTAGRAGPLFGLAMLPYLVVMFLNGLFADFVDNWCHFGGLVTGVVLAAVLDPEGLERRPGWNSTVRIGLAAVGAVWLTVLLGLGPRLHPLADAEVARRESLPRDVRARQAALPAEDRYEWLSFAVPGGWRPGNDAGGGPAFVSPTDIVPRRAFAVRASQGDVLASMQASADRWAARVVADWPGASVAPPVPTEVAGRSGLLVVAEVGDGHDRRLLEWRGVGRGAHTLEVVWQVPPAQAGRMRPLRDRLLARIEWRDPPDLVEAREEAATRPTAAHRAALAHALARAGEPVEAILIHEALLEQDPHEPDRWVEVLATIEVLGPTVSEPEAWWARALAAAPQAEVLAAVADAMAEAGRPDDARGLLRIAWDTAPGDPRIKRARRRHGLAVALDPATGAPWDLAHDTVAGRPRDPAEVDARRRAGPTVMEAREAGERIAEERAEGLQVAIDAVRAGDPGGVVALLGLKEGWIDDDPDARAALADDLESAVGGRAADWMDPRLVEALAQHPDYPALVR